MAAVVVDRHLQMARSQERLAEAGHTQMGNCKEADHEGRRRTAAAAVVVASAAEADESTTDPVVAEWEFAEAPEAAGRDSGLTCLADPPSLCQLMVLAWVLPEAVL